MRDMNYGFKAIEHRYSVLGGEPYKIPDANKIDLPFCREIGIDKVMITCIDGNIGSEKTILANGGVYEYTIHEATENEDLKRFWITL